MSATETTDVTVLVVDDEPHMRTANERFLSTNYQVRTAADGDEALAELDSSIDVVVLDRRMPSMHGDEVLDRLRDDAAVADVVVVMLSAVRPDADVVDMTFDGYLVKPPGADDLLATIEEVLALGDLSYDHPKRELHRLRIKHDLLTEYNLHASDEARDQLADRIADLEAAFDE